MILIASYPGSGIELLSKVLKDTYQITTSHLTEKYDDTSQTEVVCTHLSPALLPQVFSNHKTVCLVRDGRHAVASYADSLDSSLSSVLPQRIMEILLATNGNFYDGWSVNVAQWIQRADLVIRYEDLLEDPSREIEKLSQLCPDFPGINSADIELDGTTIPTTPEMPEDLETMFWGLHGDIMEVLKYGKNSILSADEFAAIDSFYPSITAIQKEILIEACTLLNQHVDGTWRYVDTLLRGLHVQLRKFPYRLGIKVRVVDIRALDSLFHDEKTKAESNTSAINKLFVTIMVLPRKLKNWMPNSIMRGILSVSSILGALRLYRRMMQLMNYRIIKQYESNKFDLLHYTLPQRRISGSISKHVTCTIHDLTCKLFPQYHTDNSIQITHRSINKIKDQQADIIAVSEHTKADLIEHYDYKADDIDMIYEAVDHELFYPIFDPEVSRTVLQKYELEDVQYFFSLCTLEPRKNLKNVLEAFILFSERNPNSDIQFVLSGANGWMMDKLPHHPKIKKTGYVSDEELAALYNASLATCYVSFYEGFGLPPLEAMRCKTISIYGNNSSMAEIIGDAGLAANPHDVTDIMLQMEKVAFDDNLRLQLEQTAYKRSWDFTLDKLGDQTIKHYLSLIK